MSASVPSSADATAGSAVGTASASVTAAATVIPRRERAVLPFVLTLELIRGSRSFVKSEPA
ncbi:hypothetical protein CGE01nite_09560 [Cellulomonas gelida]|uniref:Uncharacterized protein n=1 Tax=Cellulomonas gelida TaxID=1712 RepID=A0A4Y3KKR2_9CELL|nr:hypothetical protein CGE01nite_09560 [Cellulomonas gelida]